MLARELRLGAQIFLAAAAGLALPAGPGQPGDSGAITHLPHGDIGAEREHAADDFMARHARQRGAWQLPIDEVQIRAAHGAGQHRKMQLACSRREARTLPEA